jgi:putative ABC transport system permease protein
MLRVFAGLMTRMSAIVRLFSLMSIGAGILILISAVLATRAERITEAVYLKILGAPKRFIVKVFALENVLVALLSSGLALGLAQGGAWGLCRFVFDIGYDPNGWACLGLIGATVLLILAVGMGASRSILAKKPVSYLREQQNA